MYPPDCILAHVPARPCRPYGGFGLVLMMVRLMMLMELKRGSMKEKWGLTLMHRTGEGNRIELGVSKVGKFFS